MTLDSLKELKCKLYDSEFDEEELKEAKNECMNFDNDVIVSCIAGVCKNVSAIYDCQYKSSLQDLKNADDGNGYCSCNQCPMDKKALTYYVGFEKENCYPNAEICFPESRQNSSTQELCYEAKCLDCWQMCHRNNKCFDMTTRRDPPRIGKDQWDRPREAYYTCKDGLCNEITELKCKRKCDDLEVDFEKVNAIVFSGERIVAGQCDRLLIQNERIKHLENQDNFMMLCSTLKVDKMSGIISGRDCINGSYADLNFERSNYSRLTEIFLYENKAKESLIPWESDLIIKPEMPLKINMEGCVNTLSKECAKLYSNHGSDGRKSTARHIYPCFYDPNADYVILDFDKAKTYMTLMLLVIIPSCLFVLSCLCLCVCNKAVRVEDADGIAGNGLIWKAGTTVHYYLTVTDDLDNLVYFPWRAFGLGSLVNRRTSRVRQSK